MGDPAVVVHVESGFNRGVNVDLTQFTLIVGPNESGKSAIIDSIEFALRGAISNKRGRSALKAAAMIGASGTPGVSLTSHVTLSNGLRVSATLPWKPESNTFGKAHPPTFPDSFPLQAVNDALAGEPDTVRKWLLATFPAPLDAAALAGTLTGLDATSLNVALKQELQVTGGVFTSEMLTRVALNLKRLAEKTDTVAETSDNYASTRAQTLGPPPLDGEIEVARAKAAAVVRPNSRTKAEILPEMQRWVARFQEAREARKALGDVPAGASDVRLRESRLAALDTVIAWAEERATRNAHNCILCNETQLTPEKLDRTRAAVRAVREDIATVVEVLKNIEASDRIAAEMRPRVQALIDEYDAAPESNGGGEALEAIKEFEELQARKAAWDEVRHHRKIAAEAKASAQAARNARDRVLEYIREVSATLAGEFERKVQSFLGPASGDYRFRLILQDEAGNDVCQYGLVRDGRLYENLSEGTRVRVQFAMALATCKDGVGPYVFVPDERKIHPDALATWMRDVRAGILASGISAQVIMPEVVMPTGGVPEGWSVVVLGGNSTAVVAGTVAEASGKPVKEKKPRKPRKKKGEATPTAEVNPITSELPAARVLDAAPHGDESYDPFIDIAID
jgi:energy-coupling factor transporter ATP-binding protein EcfA2